MNPNHLKVHFVYILESITTDRYYVGETQDVDARLELHNDDSRGTYTSKNGPWVVKRVIEVDSRSSGRKVERYIKKRKSKKYIAKLVQDEVAVSELIGRVLSSSVG